MKKKDQESLRKIVIIGLVLVVGYLGYQSMTSGSSPFSEATYPNDCTTVKKTAEGDITARAWKMTRWVTSRNKIAIVANNLKPIACAAAKRELKNSCESYFIRGRNLIRKDLEAAALNKCEGTHKNTCLLIKHSGSLDETPDIKDRDCWYKVDVEVKNWPLTIIKYYNVAVTAQVTHWCKYKAEYLRCDTWIPPSKKEVIPDLDRVPSSQSPSTFPF